MLPIIFIVPIVQLLIIVHAATFEMKNIKMTIIDKDLSSSSRRLAGKFENSPFFKINKYTFSSSEAEILMKKGETDVILEIPEDFEKKLLGSGSAKVQVVIDAVNAMVAGLSNAYAVSVVRDYNIQIQTSGFRLPASIVINYSHWYNPELDYKNFMVPGILAVLVTLVGLILSGLNIVREKEMGTIEQINVTPIKKYQFIIGKLLPFWIIALFELAFGLSIGKLFFNIPMVGSLWLVFLSASVYLMVVLGMGLFISTLANTQQQAMFIIFFFIITFLLMSGLFTAVENMPQWAQIYNKINPIAYFIRIIRMVLLKGSGFTDIISDLLKMLLLALIVLTLSVRRYRKTA
jgi:ABC-2 type transport system permease protein